MDNRINEIRKQIRALRVSMIEAEAVMRAQIDRDEDCSFVAGDLLRMRGVMSRLVAERTELGDREPIIVTAALAAAIACAAAFDRFAPPKRQLLPSRQRA